MHAQQAFELGALRARHGIGFVDVLQDVAHPAQIALAGFGQRQPARRALQQPRAQMVFEIGHQTRDHGRRHVEHARRGGKAAFVHHTFKHPH
ncbi:hypothetical protein D3C86_1781120 [compost metagenome]